MSKPDDRDSTKAPFAGNKGDDASGKGVAYPNTGGIVRTCSPQSNADDDMLSVGGIYNLAVSLLAKIERDVGRKQDDGDGSGDTRVTAAPMAGSNSSSQFASADTQSSDIEIGVKEEVILMDTVDKPLLPQEVSSFPAEALDQLENAKPREAACRTKQKAMEGRHLVGRTSASAFDEELKPSPPPDRLSYLRNFRATRGSSAHSDDSAVDTNEGTKNTGTVVVGLVRRTVNSFGSKTYFDALLVTVWETCGGTEG